MRSRSGLRGRRACDGGMKLLVRTDFVNSGRYNSGIAVAPRLAPLRSPFGGGGVDIEGN